MSSIGDTAVESLTQEAGPGIGRIGRVPTDLVSRKTARVQSAGFHVVVGVDRTLESSNDAFPSGQADDSYETITRSILDEHGVTGHVDDVALCISYGGKTKLLKRSDKPLELLKHFTGLELDPRLFIRKLRAEPP